MADIHEQLVGLCDAFNAHDLDRIMDFFADDCVLEMPRGPHPWGARFEGRQAVRQGLASRFEGLPDVHYGNEAHFVDAERQTGITKWTLTGTTHQGKRLEVRGCDFYTFRNGRVTVKDFLLEDRRPRLRTAGERRARRAHGDAPSFSPGPQSTKRLITLASVRPCTTIEKTTTV